MNVVILAAGLGTRLLPRTKDYPKAVIPFFGEKSLLYMMLRSLAAFKTEIHNLLIIGGHGCDFLVDEVNRLDKEVQLSLQILFNPKYKAMNNCYSLLLGIEKLPEDDLLIFNADILYDPLILDKMVHSKRTSLVIDNVKTLTKESMKVYVTSGRITDISKTLSLKKSCGESIGISKIEKKHLKPLKAALETIIKENPNHFYEEAFRRLLPDIPFGVINTDGLLWTEIDDAKDLDIAKQLYQSIGARH